MNDHDKSKDQLIAELAEMHQSEAWRRSLVEDAPIFITVVDREGLIQSVNQTQPGITQEEAVGSDIYRFIQPEYHDTARNCIEQVFQTGQKAVYESVADGPHGSSCCYETLIGPIRHDGKIVAASLFCTDISRRKEAEDSLREAHDNLERRVEDRTAELALTNEHLEKEIEERKRSENKLRDSEERYRTLVETSPDAVIMTDLEGRITFASKRLLELHGSDNLEEMYGRNPLEFVAPEDHEEFLINLKKVLAEGGLGDREYTLVKRDGTRFPGEMSSTVVCNHSGEPVGLTVLVRDITERKQAQEAAEREHRVLRQMLQAQDQERQLVAYDIHDGVAQHLTAAMMQFQASNEMEDRNSDDAGACHSAGLRMLEKSLSETRRLISGLRPPILDESGIVAAIAHLIHDIRAQGGPEVDFHSSVAFDRLEPTLENSIYRITQESLTNAHQHSKADRVQIELSQKDDMVGILVEDQGCGFDPENVNERCYGLAGIRERARVLGGSSIIRSVPGEGTRIEVALPVVVVEGSD